MATCEVCKERIRRPHRGHSRTAKELMYRLAMLLLIDAEGWGENPGIGDLFAHGLTAATAIHHAAHGDAGWRPTPSEVMDWMNAAGRLVRPYTGTPAFRDPKEIGDAGRAVFKMVVSDDQQKGALAGLSSHLEWDYEQYVAADRPKLILAEALTKFGPDMDLLGIGRAAAIPLVTSYRMFRDDDMTHEEAMRLVEAALHEYQSQGHHLA